METEIIVAIIAAGTTILAAIISGIFALIAKKSKNNPCQTIKGNGNIQAGKNVDIAGGVTINAKTTDKRK